MTSQRYLYPLTLLFTGLSAVAYAQEPTMPDMPGMHHDPANIAQHSSPVNPAVIDLMSAASGTSQDAASAGIPMLMKRFDGWSTMLMGSGFIVDTQQSGLRGGDKLYSPNWLMGSVGHAVGTNGAFQIDLMLSLEPATITGERYPLLFQTGETAYGRPIVDGQHPHNFVMAFGVHYARKLTEGVILETYFAPVGDPALGPVAFPHRSSAREFPQAPISHHWQDSTHISNNVVTAGLKFNKFKWEASGFHGAEPGENRWALGSVFSSGAMDSWSTRLWFLPTRNWAAQISVGRIAHPEALEPGDQVRTTASVEYSKRMAGSSWSTSAIWGRNHNTFTQRDSNAYLLESVLPVRRGNFVTGRIEVVDKDELFDETSSLSGQLFRIAAYTVGYTRDVDLFRSIETGIGANFSAYSVPEAIQPYYGHHPIGGNMFVRFRLRQALP